MHVTSNLEVVFFWFQMKAHIFLIITTSFLLFTILSRKDAYFRYSNFDVLMCFQNSLFPSVTYLFFASEGEKKSNLLVKFDKMYLSGQGQLVRSLKYTCQRTSFVLVFFFFFFFLVVLHPNKHTTWGYETARVIVTNILPERNDWISCNRIIGEY